MRRQLYRQEGNSLFHTLKTAAISTVNQGLKQRVGNQHNRSSLKKNKNSVMDTISGGKKMKGNTHAASAGSLIRYLSLSVRRGHHSEGL